MKYLLLALMSLVCAMSEGQTTSFISSYNPSFVTSVNVESDSVENKYPVEGKCIYTMTYNTNATGVSKVVFKQYGTDEKISKTNEYPIVKMTEDDIAYDCLVTDGTGYMNIVFWKDHSMVVLENDYTRVFIMQDKD
jgi:hypothetical protein